MLGSDAIFSKLFSQANKKKEPHLPHPTAANFDEELWRDSFLKSRDMTSRDETLVKAAIIIGSSNIKLKPHIAQIFDGLTPSQAVAFAVADANRAWVIVRRANDEAMKAASAVSGAVYTSTIGRAKLDVGPEATHGNADQLNMTLVDCLPHWFAEARSASLDNPDASFLYSFAGPKAQYCFSLEHFYKEVWLQVFWEPWNVEARVNGWTAVPQEPDDRGLWSAWGWRDESLSVQQAMVHHINPEHRSDAQRFVAKTAVGLKGLGPELEIVTGMPDPHQSENILAAMLTLDSCYLSEFADDPISPAQPNITLRKLELAVRVIQDFVRLALSDEVDVEYVKSADIEKVSCAVSREKLIYLIAEALSVEDKLAGNFLDHFVSKPFEDITAVFRNGLWHRPIIFSGDENPLHIVAGAMVWGSPVRRFERWLQDAYNSSVGDDLSKTPLGIKYEELTRTRLRDALHNNPILATASSPVASISKNKAAEEIDGIVRIGSTVLVLEIKCFLSPSDPIERHNYLRKLEKAAAQATRKALWLSKNLAELAKWIGPLPSDERLRFVPLVVVNQSTGAGCRFGDCVVVDAHFLSLFFTGGSYNSGAAFDTKGTGSMSYVQSINYRSVAEAEQAIPGLFENHPGLTAYRASVSWDEATGDLYGGKTFSIAFPIMDGDKYKSFHPSPEDLLSRKI